MARPDGVMTVLGLSAGLVTGSVLEGFTGFTGEIANPENADFGDAAADFADAGAGLAATASVWGDTAAGMGDTAGVVGDAASGSAATPSDLVVAASGSGDTVSGSPAAASGLGVAAPFLCTATADFGDAASCSVDAAADCGDAALEIKEAAKTAPAVSKAERLNFIFSPKAEWIKKKDCRQHILRVLDLNSCYLHSVRCLVQTLLSKRNVEVLLLAAEAASSVGVQLVGCR